MLTDASQNTTSAVTDRLPAFRLVYLADSGEKSCNEVLPAFFTSFIGLISEIDLGIRVEDDDRDDDVSTDGHSIASGL